MPKTNNKKLIERICSKSKELAKEKQKTFDLIKTNNLLISNINDLKQKNKNQNEIISTNLKNALDVKKQNNVLKSNMKELERQKLSLMNEKNILQQQMDSEKRKYKKLFAEILFLKLKLYEEREQITQDSFVVSQESFDINIEIDQDPNYVDIVFDESISSEEEMLTSDENMIDRDYDDSILNSDDEYDVNADMEVDECSTSMSEDDQTTNENSTEDDF